MRQQTLWGGRRGKDGEGSCWCGAELGENKLAVEAQTLCDGDTSTVGVTCGQETQRVRGSSDSEVASRHSLCSPDP